MFAIRRCTLTCSTAPPCGLREHWPRRATGCGRKGACRPRWRSAAAPGVAQKVGRPCRLSGCCNAVMYARACTHARADGGQASTVLPQVPWRRPEGGPRSMNPRRGAVFRVRATSLSFVSAQGARALLANQAWPPFVWVLYSAASILRVVKKGSLPGIFGVHRV